MRSAFFFVFFRLVLPESSQTKKNCAARGNFRLMENSLKGKWQEKFLSSHLKETPKLYLEIYYRILTPALFREIF